MPGPWEKYSSTPSSGPWSKYQDGQTGAKPIGPIDNSPDIQGGAMNFAKGMQAVGGIGAPIAAIASGAPAAPILGGLAGATIAGAGMDKLLQETGAKDYLKAKARELRNELPMPQTRSEGLNFLGNLGIEMFHPKAVAASALEALPDIGTASAGALGGMAGAPVGAGVKNILLGSAKVPKGQEGSAFLNTVNEAMGAPKVPTQSSMEVGQFKQGLGETRARLGSEQGDTKAFAYNSATNPENVPATVQSSIEAALQKLGVQKGKETLAKSPEAVKALLKVSQESAPLAENIGDMNAIQSQLAARGAAARTPGSPTSAEAPFYEKAAQGIGKAIEAQIPAGPKNALDIANKAYSTILELEKMGYKMGTKGEFNPERALTLWKSVKPSDKARLAPEAVAALDELLTQKGSGILGYLVNAGKKLPNVGPTVDALMNPAKQPVRFNAPEQKLTPEMARALGISQGAVGLIPSMFK